MCVTWGLCVTWLTHVSCLNPVTYVWVCCMCVSVYVGVCVTRTAMCVYVWLVQHIHMCVAWGKCVTWPTHVSCSNPEIYVWMCCMCVSVYVGVCVFLSVYMCVCVGEWLCVHERVIVCTHDTQSPFHTHIITLSHTPARYDVLLWVFATCLGFRV